MRIIIDQITTPPMQDVVIVGKHYDNPSMEASDLRAAATKLQQLADQLPTMVTVEHEVTKCE